MMMIYCLSGLLWTFYFGLYRLIIFHDRLLLHVEAQERSSAIAVVAPDLHCLLGFFRMYGLSGKRNLSSSFYLNVIETRHCAVFCFTETWLHPNVPHLALLLSLIILHFVLSFIIKPYSYP